MENGPSISIVQKCHGCNFLSCEPEACDEAEGEPDDKWFVSRCNEPRILDEGIENVIYHDTPKWCPLLSESIMAVAEKKIVTRWILAKDRMPTKADADFNGEVFWCGERQVSRRKVSEILEWDFSLTSDDPVPERNWKLIGCWTKTGMPAVLPYPDPPKRE